MSSVNPQLMIEADGANNLSANTTFGSYYIGSAPTFSISGSTNAGTHGGTLKAQGSVDNSNWTDITSATATLTTGVDPAWLHNAEGAGYLYIRCVYTRTSGDGQLDVTVSKKRR